MDRKKPTASAEIRTYGKLTSFIFLCFLVLAFQTPCTATGDGNIRDTVTLPQNPFYYISESYDGRVMDKDEQADYIEDFQELYFSPWSRKRPAHGEETQKWIFDYFRNNNGYGQNLLPISDKWIDRLENEADLDSTGSVSAPAIAVKETSLRLLPTDEPFFLDPNTPGEGYPFDYVQNSGVHAGEPLFISHFSADGAWAWCETSYAAGWVKVDDTAIMDEEDIKEWHGYPLAVCTAEDFPVKDTDGIFRFYGKVGTILPVRSSYITESRIIVPVKDTDGMMAEREALVPEETFKSFPLPFTRWNAAAVCEPLIDKPYGWGGYGGERDCSSTVRDIFLPFGIWLPRNSAAQAGSGIELSLRGTGKEDKSTAILREGKPFSTLINKKGHVMLYIGQYRGNPIILHDTWGIRTTDEHGKEGRKIIGRTVITTLEPGKELPEIYPGGLLIDNITGMTLLGGIK